MTHRCAVPPAGLPPCPGDAGARAGRLRAGPGQPLQLPPGAIAPTDAQRATARKIGRILEEAHYSRAPIDDKMSELVFQRYLEFLDGQHSYFLASDINDFNAYRYQFDDMIRTGDIDPAYLMFARFQQRNRERIAARARAAAAPSPTGRVNETFEFDRTKAPWPADAADDGRAVAQAREERRAVADADRQDMAGRRPKSCASATSAC